VPKHRRQQGNGKSTPDWFFWSLTLIVLVVLALAFMFGDRIW
jgi:hypothetical protein